MPPEVSSDATVVPPLERDAIYVHDARDMGAVASNSVALVVTSPPYFAGKEYEESLGENGVPGSYFEYLALLRDVFEECVRVLEPGGRIAVNVANLGRRPYRSLAGDVTEILQDLGLLLRGEVVWWKGRAAGGSCAWGTFQRPSNPVLRDVTERIVIASKGRFDRALTPRQRFDAGPPLDRDHLPGRVPRGDHRPVGDRPGERDPGRTPRPVPRRHPQATDRPLHLRGGRRAGPVHGFGQHRRRGPPDGSALRRIRHRPRVRRPGRGPDRGGDGAPAATASDGASDFRVHLPAVPSADDDEELPGASRAGGTAGQGPRRGSCSRPAGSRTSGRG